jgi:ADP-heptose:LPS heptosyltransferase
MALAELIAPAEGRRTHIAVFRALMLGDMLCAVPTLRALRAAFPHADIALVGLPAARELARRLASVDRFIEFPGYPGLPEGPSDLAALPDFLRGMQRECFDLIVQLHGSGSITNPLVAACGARHCAGFIEPGDFCAEPALHAPWPQGGHEIERLLTLIDHLGLQRRGSELEFPLTDDDRVELGALWPDAFNGRPYVVVHAGARLASRRWPVERFARVAERLAWQGCTVVLTGSAGEAALVAQLQAAMCAPAIDLAGSTNLWTLGALIERAQLLVCNDTGVSQIAAALGTRSIVVSCGADVARWAPLDAERHTVLWQPMPCRPCSHAECPYDHGCATAISADRVFVMTQDMKLPVFAEEAHAPA